MVYVPIGSMYGIFSYIYHKNQPNVGKYLVNIPYMGPRAIGPLQKQTQQLFNLWIRLSEMGCDSIQAIIVRADLPSNSTTNCITTCAHFHQQEGMILGFLCNRACNDGSLGNIHRRCRVHGWKARNRSKLHKDKVAPAKTQTARGCKIVRFPAKHFSLLFQTKGGRTEGIRELGRFSPRELL